MEVVNQTNADLKGALADVRQEMEVLELRIHKASTYIDLYLKQDAELSDATKSVLKMVNEYLVGAG